MRFLIDRCAGKRLADWLRQQGNDVLESQERGADPGDRNLLMWAGVVRLPDVPAQERIVLMDVILERHETDLLSGAVITVKGERIRISRRTALP